MDAPLTFSETPLIRIATNDFVCRIPIRYKDTAVIEMIQEVTTSNLPRLTTKIPIFHPDGTKLAVVKGNQIYETEEGKKAGVTLRHLSDGTVCEINKRVAFEIRRKGAAALKMHAELHTFDGAFFRWSEEEVFDLLNNVNLDSMFHNCSFSGKVGIQIGTPEKSLGACVMINLKG